MIMQSKQISCSYSRLNTRLLSSSRWVVTLTESSPVGSALIDGRKRHDTIGIIFSKVSPSARKWFILLKIDLGVSFPSSSTFVVYSFTFTLSQNSFNECNSSTVNVESHLDSERILDLVIFRVHIYSDMGPSGYLLSMLYV